MGRAIFTPEILSDLIGAIYDCARRPEGSAEVLATIEAKVGAIASYLIIHDINADARDLSLLIERNVDRDMSRLHIEHYLKLNPLLPYLGSAATGEFYATRHLVTEPT